jgi:hypothetical protein
MLGAKIPKHKKPTTLDNDYVALVNCLHHYLLSPLIVILDRAEMKINDACEIKHGHRK